MIKIRLTDIQSHIENEDYFSLRIVYDSSIEGIRHIGFYNADDDLLEIAVNKNTNMLKRIQVTLCHHYSIIDNVFDVSGVTTINEDVCLELSDHNDCSCFNMKVYKNSAVLVLSNAITTKYVKCGQVLFGLDSEENISTLIVSELTKSDIEHIKNELLLQ